MVDSFNDLLEHRGVTIPGELRQRGVALPAVPHEVVQDGILHLYKTGPELVILFELMADFDEGPQEWRDRQLKLAERPIGRKPGTGGSPGIESCRETLFRPVFMDLLAVRSKL